jgi:MYXO-CTERM domain-containing protein
MRNTLKALSCLAVVALAAPWARAITTNFDDLAPNTLYAPGNVISSNGFQFTAVEYPSGQNVFVGDFGVAGGGGSELQMPSGSGVTWGLPAGTKYAFFRFGEFNPTSGMTINGATLPAGTRISTANGLTVGGVQIAVNSSGASGSNSKGVVFMAGTINSLTVGGVEFAMDDAVALPADPNANFNGDARVDGFDFLAWQRNAGRTSGAQLSQGDTDVDGDADSVDFEAWKFKFGWSPGGPSWPGVGIPEPGGLGLAGMGALMMLRRRR